MYPSPVRVSALHLLQRLTPSEVSRLTGISRSTLRSWAQGPARPERSERSERSGECPRCDGAELNGVAYAALLGYYLGDGCISRHARYFSLRVSCDAAYPGIIRDVETAMGDVHPGRPVFRVRAPGVVVAQSHWKHWPCLFPQHGPGRKHERPIMLEPWQVQAVEAHPAAFLRGLFHSDGSRVRNWTSRIVAGELKRYDYPRWQFTNVSADIRELCCWALDLVDVPWRQSNHKTISVSTRAAVARLDTLIGVKR